MVEKDGSSWSHPFSNVATLHAEVTELIGAEDHFISFGNIGLLTSSLTPVWDKDKIGDRFYVFDNFAYPVLDSGGRHVQFSEIKPGNIVNVRYSGLVLTSDPAIITNVYLIEIAE